MLGNYWAFLIIGTAVLGIVAVAFGEDDPFTCSDPNDCTTAAMADIADFDFGDLADILQFLFIFFGDVLQLFGTIGGLLESPIDLLVTLLFTVAWIIGILFAVIPG